MTPTNLVAFVFALAVLVVFVYFIVKKFTSADATTTTETTVSTQTTLPDGSTIVDESGKPVVVPANPKA
jgi:ABC-type enterochelin transport system substrate-binding protein